MIMPAKIHLLNENPSGLLYEEPHEQLDPKTAIEVSIPKSGCEVCNGEGTYEQIGVFYNCECVEVLTIDQLVQAYVSLKADNAELEQKLREVYEKILKITKGEEENECS